MDNVQRNNPSMLQTSNNKTTTGIFLIVTGCALFCFSIIFFKSRNQFISIDDEYTFFDESILATYHLPKDSYLLKIKQKSRDQLPSFKAFFNGIELQPNTYPARVIKGNAEIIYIHVSPSLIRRDENQIRIVYADTTPEKVQVALSNYRKSAGNGIYLLFNDAVAIKQFHILQKIPPPISILLFLMGVELYLLGKRYSPSNFSLFIKRHRPFILASHLILLVIFSGCFLLGYAIIVTPYFMVMLVIFLLIILLLTDSFVDYQFSNRTSPVFDLLLRESTFNVRVAGTLSLLVIIVNTLLYWPTFFHIFRHDEWFLFFSSRESQPGWGFFVNHIDWQLKLPYDRLMFRPISHSMLALNRILFGRNYVGPHVLTFIKHLISVFTLWWLLWQLSPRWITGLFVLLFSVLMTNVDAISWPHLDSYISTTIITLLIIVFYKKKIEGRINASIGCAILILLLGLNLLTTEITLLMPLCVFVSYWLLFRTNIKDRNRFDKSIWCILLLPCCIWGLLYAFHIYAAYPNIDVTGQSVSVGLMPSFVNIGRIVLLVCAAVSAPILTSMSYTDKVYVCVFYLGLLWSIYIFYITYKYRKRVIAITNKYTLFTVLLLLSILIILSFGRSTYINSRLNSNQLATHYSYIVTALIIVTTYSMIDFNKIVSNKKHSMRFCTVLLLLSLMHIIRVNDILKEIEIQTEPLKNYYDSVDRFVSQHRDADDFSFKIIDRPPKIATFNWYSQTCIDGLFHPYIDNVHPTYLLEYDDKIDGLRACLYPRTSFTSVEAEGEPTISGESDFVNSIGIMFNKVGPDHEPFFIGCFEVTQAQWTQVMGTNPSTFIHPYLPVENISFLAVTEFIHRLNRLEKKVSYRLPTLKEYWYLCKDTGFPAQRDEFGWFQSNAEGKTHFVGTAKGVYQDVYDVIGNVWEWTETPIHPESPTRNYADNPRICFGGSWRDVITHRSELTTNYPIDFCYSHLGFRLVAEMKMQPKEN